MSDKIRSALSPKFGDEWDRIFGPKKVLAPDTIFICPECSRAAEVMVYRNDLPTTFVKCMLGHQWDAGTRYPSP